MTKKPFTKEEWEILIVDNMVTGEDIDRIIENENLRRKIIELRDREGQRDPKDVLNELISFTEDLK